MGVRTKGNCRAEARKRLERAQFAEQYRKQGGAPELARAARANLVDELRANAGSVAVHGRLGILLLRAANAIEYLETK